MSGHTPGPWTVGAGHVVYDERHRDPVCDSSFRSERVSAANANLIAAAPCLLEALELLTTAAEYGSATGSDALRKAQAAIARAKGES